MGRARKRGRGTKAGVGVKRGKKIRPVKLKRRQGSGNARARGVTFSAGFSVPGSRVSRHIWPTGVDEKECVVGGLRHTPPCRICPNCGEWIRPEDDGTPCDKENSSAKYLQSYLEVGCAGLEREMTNIEVPR